MKRQGYHRWLLTYLPTFFISISVLISIFFFAFSSYSKQQTVKANEVFAEHMLQAVEGTLRFTEQMMMKELITDEKFRLFFDGKQTLAPYDYFEISRRLKEIITAYPPIKSMYLYRVSDHTVLTPNSMSPLEQFGDLDYIKQSVSQPSLYHWTASRSYKEFAVSLQEISVISSAIQVPLGSGSQGLLVVQIATSTIQEMLTQVSDKNVYIHLADSKNNPLFGEIRKTNKPLSRVTSDYTGWTIESGLQNKQAYNLVSLVSNVWAILGLLTIMISTSWLVYVIRRNYRPIESIKNRIQQYSSQHTSLPQTKPTGDEFHFIRTSIDNLIELSTNYEQSYKENLDIRKKWFFEELIEGERPIAMEEWQSEMQRLGLSDNRFARLTIAVLEIDQYADFCSKYSQNDQQVLKYAIAGVVREMAQPQPGGIWCEWVGNHQLGIMFTSANADEDQTVQASKFCEGMRIWAQDNFTFTVSFGIGSSVDNVRDAPTTYQQALEALQYKTNFGMNRTIAYREINRLPQGQIYRHLPDIRHMAQNYRLGEEDWKHYLNQLFTSLKTVIASRDEIISLLNYVLFTLQKEMSTLPEELSRLWEQHALEPLNLLLTRSDDLDEMEKRFYEVMNDTAGRIQSLREERDNHQLIRQVRQYIGVHYADQSLSLNHLSEAFQINLKSLSRIFKEEFGENFVDYLTKIRIEQAKALFVQQPDESIQDIAQKVGYAHSMSFIRVFKRIEGRTPGDYRKEVNAREFGR